MEGIASHYQIFSISANLQTLFATFEITEEYWTDMNAFLFCQIFWLDFLRSKT